MSKSINEDCMRQAIAMAKKNPEFPFGAVLWHRSEERVIAEGFNRSSENPIWHGEMDAINRGAEDRPDLDWAKVTLYTTAEPCSMCMSAILWAGIPEVVYGTSIPTLQALGFPQIDLRAAEILRQTPFAEAQMSSGVLEAECNGLFRNARQNQ